MLELKMIEQLTGVFTKLENPVVLKVYPSAHADQARLIEMLEDLAKTSDKIKIQISNYSNDSPNLPTQAEESLTPKFEIYYKGKPNGIIFKGIPGGHEFSSLVLAILHSDGKAKQPDPGIISRIRNLKGPLYLKTYISLTCENCPEVVQALNLMATLHPDFHHEMIDGQYAQDEVNRLGIQGVPSIISDDKLIHSGKIELSELLQRLESVFGRSNAEIKPESIGVFDVAVIGGGPAGASAAIYSVRKGLKTALIAEKLGGQLVETKGIENMISVPYTEGVKLTQELAQHLASYPVKIFEHRKLSQISDHNKTVKRLHLESGEFLDAKTIVIATGAKWRQLGIPGEKEHIGRGVAFCAHCDGPFYKDKRVAVVGGGNSGVEAAIDLAGIATHVTLLEYSDHLIADTVLIEKLKNLKNATIITHANTTEILGDGKKVIALKYNDRASGDKKEISLDGVFVQIGLLPNSQFTQGLLELSPRGEIRVDEKGRTSLPGIYAAGDVTTTPFKQIIIAMGEGAKVALSAFEDKMHEGVERSESN